MSSTTKLSKIIFNEFLVLFGQDLVEKYGEQSVKDECDLLANKFSFNVSRASMNREIFARNVWTTLKNRNESIPHKADGSHAQMLK